MKKAQKKIAISALSIMVFGSTLNLISTYAKTSESRLSADIPTELPVVEPKILSVDESKTTYKAKEDTLALSPIVQKLEGEKSTLHPNPNAGNTWSQADSQRFSKEGLTSNDIQQLEQLSTSLNETPDNIVKKMKEFNKDWKQVKEVLLQEKKYALPEALEQKYGDELKKIDLLKVSKKQRMQLITLLELRPNTKIDDLLSSFQKNDSAWLDTQVEQAYKDQQFDRSKLSKYDMTENDIEGVSPATLNQLEKLAEKVNRSFKDMVAEIKNVQQNHK